MTHYNRPGTRPPVTAVRAVLHGAPCIVSGFCGTAQKQVQPHADVGLLNNVQVTIAIGEAFVIVDKGVVEVPFVSGAVQGSSVWINDTNDALTLTDPGGGHGHKFGIVYTVPGQQGTPTGRMRVDLDQKAVVV